MGDEGMTGEVTERKDRRVKGVSSSLSGGETGDVGLSSTSIPGTLFDLVNRLSELVLTRKPSFGLDGVEGGEGRAGGGDVGLSFSFALTVGSLSLVLFDLLSSAGSLKRDLGDMSALEID